MKPAPVSSGPLQQAGPAHDDWLIHFCGRSPDSEMTPSVPAWIRDQAASVRLNSILGSGSLYGFPPFGAKDDRPMVCLSESPPERLYWLLNTRGWQPWGLLFRRQCVYNDGGGPVWYARQKQYAALRDEQKPWAVRFDTNSPNKSDWLHEREWRIPLLPEDGALPLSIDTVAAILIGKPGWEPTDPRNPLWQKIPRLLWDPDSRQLGWWDPIPNRYWWWDPTTKQYRLWDPTTEQYWWWDPTTAPIR